MSETNKTPLAVELITNDDYYWLIIGKQIVSEGHSLRGNTVLEILDNLKVVDYSHKYFEGTEHPELPKYLKDKTTPTFSDLPKADWMEHKAIK